MAKSFTFLCCLLYSFIIYGQDIDTKKISDSLVTEAKRLYHSEMASWYGTDIFLEKFKDKRDKAQGYFSYEDSSLFHCIFFSTDAEPVVLATMTFDSSFSIETAKAEGSTRNFTRKERDLYK